MRIPIIDPYKQVVCVMEKQRLMVDWWPNAALGHSLLTGMWYSKGRKVGGLLFPGTFKRYHVLEQPVMCWNNLSCAGTTYHVGTEGTLTKGLVLQWAGGRPCHDALGFEHSLAFHNNPKTALINT